MVDVLYAAAVMTIGLTGYYVWITYKMKQSNGIIKTNEVHRGALVTDLISPVQYQQEVEQVLPMRDKWRIDFKNGFKIPFDPLVFEKEFTLMNTAEVLAGKRAHFVKHGNKINKNLYADIERMKLQVQHLRSSSAESKDREIQNLKEIAKKQGRQPRQGGEQYAD